MSKKQEQTGQKDLLNEIESNQTEESTQQAAVTKENDSSVEKNSPSQPNKAASNQSNEMPSQPNTTASPDLTQKTNKKNPQTTSTPPRQNATPGQMLHKARMAKKWTIEHVAKQLRLAPAYIQEIEADQYTQISSLAYARGYLRAYSRLLEISGDTVIATFNDMNLIQETQLTPDPNVLYNPTKMNNNQTKYWLIGGTAVACLLLIVITMMLPGKHPTTQKTAITHTALTTHQSLPIQKPAATTHITPKAATPNKTEPEESDLE